MRECNVCGAPLDLTGVTGHGTGQFQVVERNGQAIALVEEAGADAAPYVVCALCALRREAERLSR